MLSGEIPSWCLHGIGTQAVLVVAPHGGRRGVERLLDDSTVKVNDLHTAELAQELAEALDASYVINPHRDRNELDLNRVVQVRARAPWFLRLLEGMLGDLLTRHARVDVLVVHGWNVTQPKCDIGIGCRLATPADADSHAAELTVSPHYVVERLAALRGACAARGITALFGERYPARHPNNVLQLFRRVPRPRPAAPQLAAWAAAGRIDAVQLELGVPVRWPGPLRNAFIDAARETFVPGSRTGLQRHLSEPRPPDPGDLRSASAVRGAPAEEPVALQCYDAVADLGIIARVEPNPAGGVSARLLLFVDRRIACLFTGEEPGAARLIAGGPHVVSEANGFQLSFRGHVLATDDGDRYVDLENAFAASVLCAVHVDLRFRALATPVLGAVSGTVEIDGAARRIDTLGFGRPELLYRSAGVWRSQLRLAAALAPDRGLRIRHEFPGAAATREELSARGRAVRPLAPVAVYFESDGSTPARMRLGEVLAEPIARMTIVRPAGPQRRARVSFGVARVTDGATQGFGFYEYARVLSI